MMQKKFSQKQIPTLLGLAILVLSLIGGIWFIGEGAGVFAPRAAPQTTPKKVKITNMKETSFSVSFVTDEATAGFIKYGTDANSLKSQASDDRDQVTGAVGQYTNHHITVRDLKPDTAYYYTLGTASTPKYDNNGAPFTIKTPKRLGAPAAAKTIYGTVTNAEGSPVGGALVYASIPGVGALSSVTKDSGSWAIPLSTARNADGTAYASINASDAIQLTVQGLLGNTGAFASSTVETAQPAPPLVISQSGEPSAVSESGAGDGASGTSTGVNNQATVTADGSAESPSTQENTSETPGSPSQNSAEQVATQNPIDTTQNFVPPSQTSQNSVTETPANSIVATDGKTVDLKKDANQIVQTAQPVITGKVPPKVLLQIEIHSDTQIDTQVKADSSGNYAIDLEALKQTLEPGQHTITISYTDPKTQKIVTETRTFTVGDQSLAQTGTTASPQPFGTDRPFTLESPTPTPSATASASAEPRVSLPATSSGKPVSGSTESTFVLFMGGAIFLIAGTWSYLHNVKLVKEKFN